MRIVIADDDPAVLRQWLIILQNDFDVIAAARDGVMALDYIGRHQPEIAILDMWMPSLDGLGITRRLKKAGSATAIILCSIETDQQFIDAARDAGALGYVFKFTMVRDLVLAVKSVAQGKPFFSPL